MRQKKLTTKFGAAIEHLAQAELYKSYNLQEKIWFAGAILDPNTGKQLEYRDLIKHAAYQTTWTKSFTKEVAQLAQGLKDIQGTSTIYFIKHKDVPKHKTVTYGRIVVDYWPQKADPHRTRLTVGGDCIQYPHDVATPTANLTTCKVLFNSTISMPNAKFATIDNKNFYLNTPLDQYEYMRLPFDIIPKEIVDEYDL